MSGITLVSNQDIADLLIQHKVYLLGYSKQLAEEVALYLKQTEPEVRELILKLFGAGAHRRITRLRDAEKRLRQIRSQAWKRAEEYITLRLLEMAQKEYDWYNKAVNARDDNPAKPESLVSTALLAGHTLKETFTNLERADSDRAVAQLRIAYLSNEDVHKATRRLAGPVSYVRVAEQNALVTVTATAIVALASSVHSDILKRSQYLKEVWVSILDTSTTQGCTALHKRKFDIGQGPTPGYHYHCRSDRIPYLEAGGPLAMDTYTRWIARQPDEFQAYAGKEFSFAKLKPISLSNVYKDKG